MTDGPTHEQHGVMMAPYRPSSAEQAAVDAQHAERMNNHAKQNEYKWNNRLAGILALGGGGLVVWEVVKRLLHVGSFPAELAGGAIAGIGWLGYKAIKGLYRTTMRDERAVAQSRP